MSDHRWLRWAPAILVALLGCGKSSDLPVLHQVKGQVVDSGQPAQGGVIIFKPEDPQVDLIINGTVDEKGRFELSTVKNNVRSVGAPEGRYQVVYIPPPKGKDVSPVTLRDLVTVDSGPTERIIDIANKDE